MFPNREELARAKGVLVGLGYEYQEINLPEVLEGLAVPFLVLQKDVSEAVHALMKARASLSGRVRYRPYMEDVADGLPEPVPQHQDKVGNVVVMSVGPCMADPEKIRLISHISGDIGKVMPYLNAVRRGSYNPSGNTFSYMDGGRMISLLRTKIAVAKAHEVFDGYATLWRIKSWINNIWERRDALEPSYESGKEITVLEIFKHLPGNNCKKCGELTCMVFAALTLQGKHRILECRPVFEEGEYPGLLPPVQQIADGYGI